MDKADDIIDRCWEHFRFQSRLCNSFFDIDNVIYVSLKEFNRILKYPREYPEHYIEHTNSILCRCWGTHISTGAYKSIDVTIKVHPDLG